MVESTPKVRVVFSAQFSTYIYAGYFTPSTALDTAVLTFSHVVVMVVLMFSHVSDTFVLMVSHVADSLALRSLNALMDDWTNVVNGVLSIAGSIGSMVATGGASAPAAVPGIVSTAVNHLKPSVEKSGALSGTGGMMGVQTPYLILTRPRQALPERQNAFTGYPSFITELLGNLQGYTEVEEIHLENVPATDGEIAEIIALLKGGVIL